MRIKCALTAVVVLVTCIECGVPEGYIRSPTLGVAYKLMYDSKSWPEAKQECENGGARLAVPKTFDEFTQLQKLVRAMHHPSIKDSDYKLLVWVGISNLEDYRIWKNLDGEDIQNTEFQKWAAGNGRGTSNAPEEPHCAGIDAINPGLRDFWCHRKEPYVCQINI